MSNDFKVHIKKLNLVLKLDQLYLFDPSIFFQINFSIKIHLCYFLVSDLRDKRERSPDSNVGEIRMLLAPISVIKMVDFYVKWFRLIMKV